ncbi:3-oxoacyl-ACP reductase FabG [Spirosoma sp. BT702]|uniref:3-oxoacyl-[acyl-carrier-protein] reductase FabG n=1 Tax=Spirosoma profusum TaxID=2771354 RepID=A0A927AT63_9BACT|nr:3-oxoacyl-ACP reductase FabG [Spirosoma profusum]MBD2702705.1 3-oxoacyl-ACP reductase FabG [Spirosoma profusum]
MTKLHQKVAIVTGGAGGIGRAIAERFAEEGAQVVIWDVESEATQRTASELNRQGLSVTTMPGIDITQVGIVQQAVETVLSRFGTIHVLVNNAGITQDSTLRKLEPEKWQRVLDVNLTGALNCTQAVLETMIGQHYGRIVNMASSVGIHGNFGQTNYVAAKAGLIGMTKVWGRELGKYGITVNAIAPGAIQTAMFEAVPDTLRQMIQSRIAVGRLGQPEDIAHAALFLASDEASFITGQTLEIDGGLYLG